MGQGWPSSEYEDLVHENLMQVREPHPDISCWWTLYDYGIDTVKTWAKDYKHPYPGERRAQFTVQCTHPRSLRHVDVLD